MGESEFKNACDVLLRHGYVPVQAEPYARLRAWLNTTDGWPPRDWQPETDDEWKARQ